MGPEVSQVATSTMFFTFSKSDNTPTIPSRPHNATACYECRRKKVNCSKEQPSCRKCTVASTPCYYPSATTPFRCKPASRRQKRPSRPAPLQPSMKEPSGNDSLESQGSSGRAQGAEFGIDFELDNVLASSSIPFQPLFSLHASEFEELLPPSTGDDYSATSVQLSDEFLALPATTDIAFTSPPATQFLDSPSESDLDSQQYCSHAMEASRCSEADRTTQSCRCNELIEEQLSLTLDEEKSGFSMLSAARDSIQTLSEVGKCPECISCRKSVMLLLVLAEKLVKQLKSLVGHSEPLIDENATCGVHVGVYEIQFTEEFAAVYKSLLQVHLRRLLSILHQLGQSIHGAGWSTQLALLSGVSSCLHDLEKSMER